MREREDKVKFSVLRVSVYVCTRQPLKAWLFSDLGFFRFRVGKLEN